MTTILVLTKQSALASAIQSVLAPESYQLVVKDDVWEADSLLGRRAIDIAIVDSALTDVRAIRLLEELRQSAPDVPIIVYASAKQWEWEEDAYMLGVEQVLTMPVRGRLLNTLLDRLVARVPNHAPAQAAIHPALAPSKLPYDSPRTLEALRDFATILTYGLNPEGLLKEFLLLLRQIIGVNRAMIFLRRPAVTGGDSTQNPDDRWMRCACAIGIEQTLLEHFALSVNGGIGGFLYRQGRILRAHGPEAASNREILKEFQLVGGDVAIPILDRESLVGVAVLDERVTGEPYHNEELALIFQMLEEVGLAIRNSWLHNQLAGDHAMLVDILRHLSGGCIVIGSNTAVLHANQAAIRLITGDESKRHSLEFSDIPQELGSKVFAVVKTGSAIPPFKYQLPGRKTSQYQVTISPFRLESGDGNAALLILEDITQLERSQRLEIEASNLRLVKAMAEHLAHEIGNSLVPLSTHQQLLDQRYSDAEFRKSLSTAMADGVKRISRLSNQMMFLAREKAEFGDTIALPQLIKEAFKEANSYCAGLSTDLDLGMAEGDLMIAGDRKALRHAFLEVLLNALQANPAKPEVAVKIEKEDDENGSPVLNIEVQDSGEGFSSETASKAITPFFSTRNVGLGLGLTVTRKIIEDHKGLVEIEPTSKGDKGVVRISLPLAG